MTGPKENAAYQKVFCTTTMKAQYWKILGTELKLMALHTTSPVLTYAKNSELIS